MYRNISLHIDIYLGVGGFLFLDAAAVRRLRQRWNARPAGYKENSSYMHRDSDADAAAFGATSVEHRGA